MENRKVLSMDETEIVEKAFEIGKTRYDAVKNKISKMVPVNRWKII
jgi:hypothetical protein